MVIEEFFEDLGSMWMRGPATFFPTAERRESDVEVMFLQDGNGPWLRQPVAFAPNFEFLDRWVNSDSSYLGGEGFSGFEFGLSLSQALKAFAKSKPIHEHLSLRFPALARRPASSGPLARLNKQG
jgi:hypothetical protein